MDPAEPTRLTLSSWKDIAAFLGRNVRTVQRWEEQEGLPVHRHKHLSQHSVYAYPDELHAWWRNRTAGESAPPETIAPAEDPSPIVSPTPAAGGSSPAARPVAPRRRRWLWASAACAIVTLGLVAVAGNLRDVAWLGDPGFSGASVVAVFEGTHADDYFSAGPHGDLNGDGRNDALFSSQIAGEIYVLLGGVAGRQPRLPDAADVTISTTLHAQLAPSQIADFDGDGLADLLVHTYFFEPETFHGTAPTFILRGRTSWPRALRLPEDADITFRPRLGKDIRMGGCTSPPFDVNGDGIADLLLGGADHSPAGTLSAGGVFVLFGRRDWRPVIDPIEEADITFEGSRSGEGLSGICAVRDFNRDGRMDVALFAEEQTLWNLLGGRGRVYVWYAPAAWPKTLQAANADFRIDGTVPTAGGPTLLGADVTGDGAADLVTGWPTTSADPARVAIWVGGATRKGVFTPDQADAVIVTGTGPSGLGASLSTADFDQDGIFDLVLGTPDVGRMYMLFGRSSWPKRATLDALGAVWLFASEEGTSASGIRAVDLNGDSLPDLTVTCSKASTRWGRHAGRGWVLQPHLTLSIDVRPTSAPNILYYPLGVLVTRVPGRGSVNADQIDPGTLRLAGVAADRYVLRDFDGDGVPELQAYFDTSRMRV